MWAIDLIGHGWSDLSTDALEVDDYVRHVIAFMDEWGIERAVLAGVSLGGWVATKAALEHPERVASLVLATPGGSRANAQVMSTIRRTTSVAATEPTWEAIRARLEYLVHDPARITDDLVATRMAIYRRPGMAENMARVLVLQDPDIRARNLLSDDQFRSLACPVLVIWTEHDPTAPVEEGWRVARLIPESEFVVLEDAGHWPQFEKPDEFNSLVRGFLERSGL